MVDIRFPGHVHPRPGISRVTATITDQAGNRTSSIVRYRVLSTYLEGVPYSRGAFEVRPGHVYTIISSARRRPRYFDAAVYPRRPTQRGHLFYRAVGHHRWALAVAIDPAMRSHPRWTLGVEINGHLQVLQIRII